MAKRRGKPSPALLHGPVGLANSRPFFTPEDLPALARAAGRPLAAGADPEALAERLEEAAAQLVLGLRASAEATAGEKARWAREVEGHARALLDAFGAHGEQDRPSEQQLRAFNVLCAGAPPTAEVHDLLRRFLRAAGWSGRGAPFPVVRESGAVLVEPDALWSALLGVRVIAERARLAAEGHERRKGRRDRAQQRSEVSFFDDLREIYKAMFGLAPRGVSMNYLARERGGPFVRFCQEVVAVVRDRLDDIVPESDRVLLGRLDTLARSPGAVAERIRDLKSGGLVRKR